MKKLLQLKLKILSQKILEKYQPKVIAITGSVGKTSAKEAIYAVLSGKYLVRESIKNYNNEIGVPLTIIGADSPGKSIFGWIFVCLKALKLILLTDENYPKILILEMGIDRPGDMDYLMSIVKPDIGVATAIGQTHLEFFDSIEYIKQEKAKLIKSVKQSGVAILNYDDKLVLEMLQDVKTEVITFGFDFNADVKASNLFVDFNKKTKQVLGLKFTLKYHDSLFDIKLPKIIGKSAVYSVLAAISVGLAHKMKLEEIIVGLESLKPTSGRLNLIDGIKRTLIIDDTYNSSPQSSAVALDALKSIPVSRGSQRFAVLGDMLELGSYSQEGHLSAGKRLVDLQIDKLVVVGELSSVIADGAKASGMDESDISYFQNSEEAGRFVQDQIQQGDLILVKGSQGVRMEKVVKELMAEPLRAKELLVRQGEEWN